MFTDTHAHLHFRDFAEELPSVIQRASDAGVKRIVTIATDVPTARQTVEIAGKFEGVYAAVGLHPGDVPAVSLEQMPEIRELAGCPKVVAIGETGLDYYREARKDHALREQQRELFRAHLELAKQRRLPVVIHNREADADMLAMVREHEAGWRPWGVMHCFAGDAKFADDCIEAGLMISYTGILTYKNAAVLQETAKKISLEHVMLETDSPYLAPVPHRGERNEPSYIPIIASALAALKGVSVEEVARVTEANAARLFRWERR